jgi:hypothetical protein
MNLLGARLDDAFFGRVHGSNYRLADCQRQGQVIVLGIRVVGALGERDFQVVVDRAAQ